MSEERKTVGFEIPDHLHRYLVLNAFYFNTSKSQLIRKALSEWQEGEKLGEQDLLNHIGKELQIEWDKKTAQNRNDNKDALFQNFQDGKRLALNKAGIPPEDIDYILKQLKA